MGALLAGSRELGPDEYHRKLNHVRNCQTCTGPFVKTLIAQVIYLMLCGIRLIQHGTRLTRVCIFRYTWASSCHGWNSYGTRRPRVCGIPCVSATRVPAGRAPRTHEGRVCGPPANWGQACTAKSPPGTRPARVSCNRANSAQVCTGATLPRTREGRVYGLPANSASTCTGPGAARTCLARVYGPPANSRQECTGVLDAAKRGSSNHGGFTAGAGRARRSWPRLSIQWGKAPARRPRRRRCRIICCDV